MDDQTVVSQKWFDIQSMKKLNELVCFRQFHAGEVFPRFKYIQPLCLRNFMKLAICRKNFRSIWNIILASNKLNSCVFLLCGQAVKVRNSG